MAARETHFTWKTGLTPEQVRDALAQRVQPGELLALELGGRSADGKEYRGEVTAAGFKLVRRALGRNSFVPIVTGVVRASGNGAEVEVTMALPLAVTVFVAAWTAIAAGVLLWLIATMPEDAGLAPVLAFLPFPLVAPAVGWLVFSREVRQATEFLKACLPTMSTDAAPAAAAAPDASPPASA
jgi:hypothetical protein